MIHEFPFEKIHNIFLSLNALNGILALLSSEVITGLSMFVSMCRLNISSLYIVHSIIDFVMHSFRSPQRKEDEKKKINWKTNHYVERITEYIVGYMYFPFLLKHDKTKDDGMTKEKCNLLNKHQTLWSFILKFLWIAIKNWNECRRLKGKWLSRNCSRHSMASDKQKPFIRRSIFNIGYFIESLIQRNG